MAASASDRRRFFLATTLTLLALPALWWVNRSEGSAAPNVAVAGAGVGVDVDADHSATADTVSADAAALAASAPSTSVTAATGAPAPTTAPPAEAAPTDTVPGDEPGAVAPVFLDGPSAQVGAGLPEIAVPARPEVERVTAPATFRHNLGGNDLCAVPGVINGRTVTLVNLDNGRNVTCVTTVQPGAIGDEVLVSTPLFSQLADLTDAPIPVEIRR